MASVHDRLQMNRNLLDNWNKREQLCLASAVSSSGDQNWISVSHRVKLVCGNQGESSSRPADWFSQKSCALQYANLLENVETPKRKKRTSESNSRVSSPATVDTPIDSVLRRLTEERIQELKAEIRKDQEEYAKLYADLQKIQSSQFTEEMLQEMWRDIEKEQETQRIAEMKLENQLREREQRRLEVQRSWRLGTTTAAASVLTTKTHESNMLVDMDVEEIIGVSKSNAQQQIQQPTATSPLLSSLLKSPTATIPPTLSTTSTARTTAPTITTLLTSGSIPNTNQPAITLNSNLIPPDKAVQLLSRPISGPKANDTVNVSNAVTQNLLSPSQSAPTLSMLLERNKAGDKDGTGSTSVSKSTIVPANEANKEVVAMEIDESIITPQKEVEPTIDSDETDPNEEQQLLEVFKNIGNIDELIDVSAEEVDFLKGVDESPSAAVETMDFEKVGETSDPAKESATTTKTQKTEEEKIVTTQPEDSKINDQKDNEIKAKDEVVKIETSSDDSNDNIPLAAVATLENKERSSLTPTQTEAEGDGETEEKIKLEEQDFLKEQVESAKPSGENNDKDDIPNKRETILPIKRENSENEKKEDQENSLAEEQNTSKEEQCDNPAPNNNEDTTNDNTADVEKEQETKPIEEETTDDQIERFSTPTGDDKLMEEDSKQEELKKDAPNIDEDTVMETSNQNAPSKVDDTSNNIQTQQTQENNIELVVSNVPLPPPSTISIADTDEDSCTTDISIITPKREEKPTSKQPTEKSTQSRKTSTQDAASKSTDDSDSSSANRASKRSLLSILNNLTNSKSAQTIQRALNDDHFKTKYQKICYRRLDFAALKKNIENGTIRSVAELQRDFLLITQNIYFLFPSSHPTYRAAEVFKHEMQNIREFVYNAHEFETKTEKEVKEIKQAATKQLRTGSRKSQRIA